MLVCFVFLCVFFVVFVSCFFAFCFGFCCFFFFSSRRRHTRSLCDWSSDVCSSDLSWATRSTARARCSGSTLTRAGSDARAGAASTSIESGPRPVRPESFRSRRLSADVRMANRLSKIFCQRCMAGNEIGQELCARCGTRLMLVVEPSASRFEGGGVSGGMEEHILERISVIENSLSRLVDKLGQMADLLLRHSRTAHLDHALLDTLVDVLNEAGVVRRRVVEAAWRERYRHEKAVESGPVRDAVCEKIISLYEGEERELFARLVREGFAAVDTGKAVEGLRTLERAAALAPGFAPLN